MIISRKFVRKASLWLHRWIGLTLGLVFVGYGLTGSYIVYMDEIEAWNDPSMKRSVGSETDISLDALAKVANLPEGALRIRVPEEATRNVEFLFNSDPALRHTEYMDPATMESAGTRKWSNSLSGVLYTFHHDLFLGAPGKTVTAIQASFVLAMLVIGLWLWLPPKGQRLAALKHTHFMRARSTLRTHLELHKLVGIYAAILLIITVASGIIIARSDWFLQREKPAPIPTSTYSYAALDHAIKQSGLPTRGHQLRIRAESVTLTRSDGSAYLLNIDTQRFEPRTRAQADDRIYDFIRDIHGGRYWSGNGAMLTFTIGLLPLLFYITGMVIWWKKRKNKRARVAS